MLIRLFRRTLIAFSPEKALYFDLKRIFGEYPGRLMPYKVAFIHRSASMRTADNGLVNNERLEYLGDAVLNAIVADYLFENYPKCKEGQLTQMRSRIVNHNTLAQIARNLSIDKYIMLQAKVQHSGKYFYGDMIEALVGALYIDKGYKCTKKIVLTRLLKDVIAPQALVDVEVDFKSRVIEWCQKSKYTIRFNCQPKCSEDGFKPLFHADILINGELASNGAGASKKEAEQNAARVIWEKEIII